MYVLNRTALTSPVSSRVPECLPWSGQFKYFSFRTACLLPVLAWYLAGYGERAVGRSAEYMTTRQ